MSAKPRRLPMASAPGVDVPLRTFAQKLQELMTRKGLSQSDLARAVWGTYRDSRDFEVARNRDRISQYVKGKSIPEPSNLLKLAEALGVTPEELAPDITADAVDAEEAAVSMRMVEGHPDKTVLRINTVTSFETAAEIIALLSRTTRLNS